MLLSGTFGELRSNHFHAGLDIKSARGIIGDTVYAAGVGYISRIQVNAFGYGNVIFIDHPNGFTTVYGHLDRFAPMFQQYVKDEQYRQQQFEVDLLPCSISIPGQSNGSNRYPWEYRSFLWTTPAFRNPAH
jgi:hypothetical protein